MTKLRRKIRNSLFCLLLTLSVLCLLTACDDEELEGFFDEEEETEEAEETAGEKRTFAGIEPVSAGTDAKSATIMIYMNGSDLETKAGEATRDISEMLSSGVGGKVNVIIQTMGTREWHDYGISSETAQTWRIQDGKLELIRDQLGQLDCTKKETLSEFIGFCAREYPADRYLFSFWDHGGGPVYGFGYDEWQGEEESLTLAEMAGAFSENPDIRFDIIGMDCCIMADLETCLAFAPYCKYTLLSEDFESELGWNYRDWMEKLEENPGISTPVLGKYIVDGIIESNENSMWGDSSCLGLFNESAVAGLFSAWKSYAYRNEDALLNRNYSRMHRARGRRRGEYFDDWGMDGSNVTLSDYYISDVLAIVENVDSTSGEAENLKAALKASVAYYGHTSDKNELTGMAVSLPYGDSEFYSRLKSVYGELGIDQEYIDWLGQFVSSPGYDNYADYGEFEDSWEGWGAYGGYQEDDGYGCAIGSGACDGYGDYDEYGDYDGYGCEDPYGYGAYGYDDYGGDGADSQQDIADGGWVYDYEEGVWYSYENGYLYLYDEETDTTYYYDEDSDSCYYYDERNGEWIPEESEQSEW